jgi:VIT1/CCC1 family predicted Fe2+/Mn2+ transporter
MTFFGFVFAGFLPLFPYLFNLPNKFFVSSMLVFIELFVIGGLRTINTKRKWIVGAIEMLLVAGVAALVAYYVGYFVESLLI